MATGLQVRTETITMTDMNHGDTLIEPRCMLGAKQARRGWETSWGKQTISDEGGKKGESFHLSTDHIFTITLYHLHCGLVP